MQCTIGEACIVRDALRHVLTQVLRVPAAAVHDGSGAAITVRWRGRDYVGVLPLVQVLRRTYAEVNDDNDDAARRFLGLTDATTTLLVNQWLVKAAQLCVDAAQYSGYVASARRDDKRSSSNKDGDNGGSDAARRGDTMATTLYGDVERAIEASKLHSSYLAGTTRATVADVLLCAAVCQHPCSPYTCKDDDDDSNNNKRNESDDGCCCFAPDVRAQLLLHGATAQWCRHVCGDAALQPLACCRALQQATQRATAAATAHASKKHAHTTTTTTAAAAAATQPRPVYVKPSEQEILRRRREKEAERAAKAAAAAAAGNGATAATTAAAAASAAPSIDALDVRVGRFTNVRVHPHADRQYVEDMQLGDETRTVVSGLIPHYTRDQLEGALCLVVCNIKPRALKGVTSQGMVLCTMDDKDTVHLLSPPDGAAPGDRIVFAPSTTDNSTTRAHKPLKESHMSELLAHLRLDDEARLSWKGQVAQHTLGVVTGPASMANCRVS